jgi:hypothetical protein
VTYAPQVLATRVLPRSRVATVAAVVGFAVLTAVAAQWWIVLPFTPVPITGQTFAVLLSGAALGWRAGAASQTLYLVMGFAGLPVFTEGASGADKLLGATGGYLVGFVVAGPRRSCGRSRHHDPVGDVHDQPHVVLDEDHRDPQLVLDVEDEPGHVLGLLEVHTRHRLVEQQQLGSIASARPSSTRFWTP